MSKNEYDEIDWSKVPGVGTSNPKKDYKEILKGFWLVYLYLCLVFFGLIVADIIDGTNTYLGSIRFWILFFIPCVIYLIVRAFRLFDGK